MVGTFRWVALLTWLVLVGVSVTLAPAADPNTSEVVARLLTGRLAGLNLSLVALFSLMGVWPMVFLCLLAPDAGPRARWRWPFVLGAFALGAFALLPYLVVRAWGAPRRPPAPWLRWTGARGTAVVLAGLAVLLLALFFAGGDLSPFLHGLAGDQFAWVMCADFLACSVAGLLLSLEDAALRPQAPAGWWALGSVVGVPARLALAPLAPGQSIRPTGSE